MKTLKLQRDRFDGAVFQVKHLSLVRFNKSDIFFAVVQILLAAFLCHGSDGHKESANAMGTLSRQLKCKIGCASEELLKSSKQTQIKAESGLQSAKKPCKFPQSK